jgi:hypothetical protein
MLVTAVLLYLVTRIMITYFTLVQALALIELTKVSRAGNRLTSSY